MAKGSKLRIIPLGGVGEIGKNSTLVEYGNDIVLVDAGVKFPEEGQYGIDYVVPDYTYLLARRDRLRGIVLTHGHEDHIGGLPFLLPQLGGPGKRPVPVWGTDITMGLVKAKLGEHRLGHAIVPKVVVPRTRYELTPNLSVEFVQVCHSIPGSMAIAITTPEGTVFFTGDFKFDPTPTSGPPADEERLREIGDAGVLVMLSDTTRVEVPGHTPSEQIVKQTVRRAIAEAPGRVLLATFSSNITRLQHAIESAVAHNRKIALAGRSMERNLQVAMELGYVRAQADALVPIEKINRYAPKELLILMTGSQGEPNAALSRIAAGEHRKVRLLVGDTILFASSPVPGNEGAVSRTIDNLFHEGANVLYNTVEPTIHVSGHGAREELRHMLQLIRPRYAVPVHGEFRHQVLYRRLAAEEGIPAERVLVPELGDILQFSPTEGRKVGVAPNGSVLIDGLAIGRQVEVVLRERSTLAQDGFVTVSLLVNRRDGTLAAAPTLSTGGFVSPNVEQMLADAGRELGKSLDHLSPRERGERAVLGKIAKEVVGGYVFRRTQQRPMIHPIVTEV